jgi:cytochrome c oxidase subunit I
MNDEPDIHMPQPSFWPIVLAAGMLLIAFGVVLNPFVGIAGVAVLLAAIAGWALENRLEAGHHE